MLLPSTDSYVGKPISEPKEKVFETYGAVIPALDLYMDTGENFMEWTVYGKKELPPKGLAGIYKRPGGTTVPVGEDVLKKTEILGGNALIGAGGVYLQPSSASSSGGLINTKFNLAVGVTTLELN